MRNTHWALRLAALLLVSYSCLVVGVMAAGGPGSEGDPLVTVSYLNETFTRQIMTKVDEKLAARDKELSDKLDAQVRQDLEKLSGQPTHNEISGTEKGDNFTVLSLSNGQTLTGGIGCEVMLRVGTATCVTPSTPGLIDETDGSTIGNNAKLTQNHLYMMTVEGRGVKAAADTVKLMVLGEYKVK